MTQEIMDPRESAERLVCSFQQHPTPPAASPVGDDVSLIIRLLLEQSESMVPPDSAFGGGDPCSGYAL